MPIQKTITREKAVAMVLAGYSIRQISGKLRTKPSTVRRWLASPKAQRQVDKKLTEIRDYASRRLRAHADEMINVVLGIANGATGDEKASDRLRAACAALDRIGLEAARTTADINVNVLTTESAPELIARARQLSAEMESIIEVEGDASEKANT